MKLTFDIESNGLLDTCSTIWCLVAQDIDTKKIYAFSDYDNELPSLKEGLQLLQDADVLIGHNIIGYDIPAIKIITSKFTTGVDLIDKKCYDTLIMSQMLRYKRSHKHGLAGWGKALGNNKLDYDDWTRYTKEMLTYCIQDVELNTQVYYKLVDEFKRILSVNPLIKTGLMVEHEVSKFNTIVREEGWNFNVKKAKENLEKLKKLSKDIEDEVEPKLGYYTVYIDKTPKTAKFKKDGTFNAVTCRLLTEYFGKEVKPEDTHLMPPGKQFQRTVQTKTTMGQIDQVKDWLKTQGWKPDDYTRKMIMGRWVNVSPKLTETSLSKLGELGKKIGNYYTLRNRISVLTSWIENLWDDSRIHGNMWTIGTPSFRCRHEVIVNLPGVHSLYGRELRELFEADDGWKIVGADSSGNQLRGLCHYVNNPEFTKEVIYGDQHQRNADALGCSRSTAKTFLYAYLFGAGDSKLGETLTGKKDAKRGKQSRADFASAIKGLQEIKDKIEGEWRKREVTQGNGWIHGLDGRPVFISSEHQCLNYLLQSAEGITCKAATVYQMQKIKEEGLRARPRIFYHDETAWTAHPDDADRVGEILKESFAEAPKWFGVECMDGGDYIVGTSYADVH